MKKLVSLLLAAAMLALVVPVLPAAARTKLSTFSTGATILSLL